jgi:CBS-domain-containing membrane protein
MDRTRYDDEGWGRYGRETGEYGERRDLGRTRGERGRGEIGRGEIGRRELGRGNAMYRSREEELSRDFGEGGRDWNEMGRDWGQPVGRGREGSLRLRRLGRRRRDEVLVDDIMTRDVKTARPDDSLRRCAELMRDEQVGIIPVVDDRMRLLGVITDRDVVCRAIAEGRDVQTLRTRDVMTREVECVTADTTVKEALEIMAEEHVRRIPVVDRDDRLRGLVSMVDVAREASLDEELSDALAETSTRRSFWSQLW